MSKVSIAKHYKISKVIITGNKHIETAKIKSFIAPYLSKGISAKEAKRVTSDIENYYRDQGYFLPVAHIDVAESVLKVTIIEGKIKNVFIVLKDEKRDKKVSCSVPGARFR